MNMSEHFKNIIFTFIIGACALVVIVVALAEFWN